MTVLDEPVVITHGHDGALRAFYNVCRHRAGQVALTRGTGRSSASTTAGPTVWTAAFGPRPRWRTPRDFDPAFGLRPVRVDRLGPFVFVNLYDERPARGVAGRHPRGGRRAASTSTRCAASSGATTSSNATGRSTSITISRATTCPSRTRPLPRARLRRLPRRDVPLYSKQHAPVRDLKPGQELGVDRRYLRHPARRTGPLLLAVPEHDVQPVPGQREHERDPAAGPRPDSDDLRVVLRGAGSGGGRESMQQTIAFSDEIQQEDIVLCEQVQRGLRSRSYDWPLHRQARERRAPLPVPRPGVPRRMTTRADGKLDGRPDLRGLLGGRWQPAPSRAPCGSCRSRRGPGGPSRDPAPSVAPRDEGCAR